MSGQKLSIAYVFSLYQYPTNLNDFIHRSRRDGIEQVHISLDYQKKKKQEYDFAQNPSPGPTGSESDSFRIVGIRSVEVYNCKLFIGSEKIEVKLAEEEGPIEEKDRIYGKMKLLAKRNKIILECLKTPFKVSMDTDLYSV